MGRIKIGFRLCLFSLCVFVLAVIKADSNEKLISPNPNVAEDPELPVSLVLERLDALEKRFLEEMNRQFKSLKKELDDMKNEDSSDGGLSLLTPPIRGPRGEKGEKGDSNGLRGSYSMPIRPSASVPLTTTAPKEIQWGIERPGENWIVAKEISRWEPNGRWGNVQLCPPATFVTAHKFSYLSQNGITEVELTCTNKYKTEERENGHFLRLKSADEPEVNLIGEEWDILNQGNRTNFAQGFSLNRRILERRGSAPEIRKISKTYDLMYHGQTPETSTLNSSGIVTQCPENHAICGLIPMMDNAGQGILSAVGFKCCDVCTPEEKWVTVHQFNNTNSSNETVEFNATVGFQPAPQHLNSTNLNLESAADSVGFSPSDFYKKISAHLSKSNFTGFDWTRTNVSMTTEETNLPKSYTCGPQSSCVYAQLVGQCGNVQIPVDQFCLVSVPVGSSLPEPCTQKLPDITSCRDAMEILPSPRSPKQTIYPHGNSTKLEVLCDFEVDGGGWTIIQKRTSGPKQEFNHTWNEYTSGFGSLDKNFWLGLDNIHALTQNGDQELRIELEDFEGEKRVAKYSSFSISDASDFYRLAISGFSGDAGDSMTYHNRSKFTTKDKDNDVYSSGNCAVVYGGDGGWWFNGCSQSTLNGHYYEKGEPVPSTQGIYWYYWKGPNYSLAKTEMKIRTRKS